jgi:hypothetical protein
MKRLVLITCLCMSAWLPSRVAADPAPFKNLQVLPKTTTKEQIKVIMKGQAKALGVECDFCHDVPDMAADTLEHKKIARQMMRMTDDINAKWVKPLGKDAEKHPVTCTTCHAGKPEPAN